MPQRRTYGSACELASLSCRGLTPLADLPQSATAPHWHLTHPYSETESCELPADDWYDAPSVGIALTVEHCRVRYMAPPARCSVGKHAHSSSGPLVRPSALLPVDFTLFLQERVGLTAILALELLLCIPVWKHSCLLQLLLARLSHAVVHDKLDVGFQLLSKLDASLRVAVPQQQARLSIVWTFTCALRCIIHSLTGRSCLSTIVMLKHHNAAARKQGPA